MNTNAKAHAFVVDLDAPELDPDDRHHFARVLRLRRGDTITVSDGDGRWRLCRFGDPLEPSGPIEHEPPAAPRLTVAFAVVKGERTEWAVQKLVELGVDTVIPFVADRSVVRWDPAKSEQPQPASCQGGAASGDAEPSLDAAPDRTAAFFRRCDGASGRGTGGSARFAAFAGVAEHRRRA